MTDYMNKLIVIVGPTASGKSDWGLRIAKKYRGAIISADSRQIYSELSIGTNVPDKKTQRRAPHFLIQNVKPTAIYSAANFQKDAASAIKQCWEKNFLPIMVGGTGLYISSITNALAFPNAKPNPNLRAILNQLSTPRLYNKLLSLAPKTAHKIDRHNKHRLIRAIEIALSANHETIIAKNIGQPRWQILQIGIRTDRAVLYHKINARVDYMIRRGLIAETKRMVKKYSWKAPALTGIGYSQIGRYLRGEISRDEAIRLIKRDTRHYAKRQLTWFRRDRNIHWFAKYAKAENAVRMFMKK